MVLGSLWGVLSSSVELARAVLRAGMWAAHLFAKESAFTEEASTARLRQVQLYEEGRMWGKASPQRQRKLEGSSIGLAPQPKRVHRGLLNVTEGSLAVGNVGVFQVGS